MVRGLVIVISGFVASAAPAQGAAVVFSAPPQLRAQINATLKEKGRTPIDLSELDDALYGPKGAKGQVAAGKQVTLKASLPNEVRADFAAGQTACRARRDQSTEARLKCAEQLVGAVWERHLDRLKADLVIEFRSDEQLLEMAIYRPGDATISGGAQPWAQKPTAREFVFLALEARQQTVGTRPNWRELPAATDPSIPAASLSQGAPQSLAALEVPKGCALSPELVVEPANAPLAVTISTLWRATAAAQVKPDAKQASCTLALTGDPAEPSQINFTCGNEGAWLPLNATSNFAEKSFQAELAKMFVAGRVRAQCEPAALPKTR